MVERLLLLAEGEVTLEMVELAFPREGREQRTSSTSGPLAERVAGFERETIVEELERNKRNITNAAKALGLERSYLYKKCRQLGIVLRPE